MTAKFEMNKKFTTLTKVVRDINAPYPKGYEGICKLIIREKERNIHRPIWAIPIISIIRVNSVATIIRLTEYFDYLSEL